MVTLELNLIAAHLEGLEETIIYKLIDRAQFRVNAAIYQRGKSGFDGADGESLFDLRLRYHEEMDAAFGRFCVPEERPFTKGLPGPRRAVTLPEGPLRIENFDRISLTDQIRERYLQWIPSFCRDGDDGQYGSSVEHDVYALQAISRRIHYGALYVAESKFLQKPQEYRELIARGDREGLMELLTRKEVEERIVDRVRQKMAHVQEGVNRTVRHVIDPELVLSFYRDHIIPLTKEGEIRYLMGRIDNG
jgi:chorismate mutase